MTVDEDTEHALSALVIEWAWRVDHAPADAASLFVEDGLLDVAGKIARGRAELDAGAQERIARQRVSRHVVSNLAVVVDAPDRGRARGVLAVYRHDGAGTGNTIASSVFDFAAELVRGADGRWRFASHVMTRIFARPVVP